MALRPQVRQAVAISLDIQRREQRERQAVMAAQGRQLGFKGLVRRLQAQGYSREQAERIAAHAARSASASAKRANPRLRRVPG